MVIACDRAERDRGARQHVENGRDHCDTLIWPCVPHVLCWPAFLLVSALGSTGSAANSSAVDCSAAECSALFVGFTATMAESDFSCPCIIGYGSSPSRCGPPYARANSQPTARRGISQVPTQSICA